MDPVGEYLSPSPGARGRSHAAPAAALQLPVLQYVSKYTRVIIVSFSAIDITVFVSILFKIK